MLLVRSVVLLVEMGVCAVARRVRFALRSSTVTDGSITWGMISTSPLSMVDTIWYSRSFSGSVSR